MQQSALLEQASRAFAVKDLNAAEQYCWSALGNDPGNARAFHLLGLVCRERGDVAQALDYLNRSVLFDSGNAAAFKDLGDLHVAMENLSVAVAHYERALSVDPTFADAYDKLGVTLHRLKSNDRAIEAFQEARRLDPGNAEFAYNLGTTFYRTGAFEEAISQLQDALRLQPDYADASNNLAVVFKKQGRFEEAAAQFKETLRIQPDHELALYNLSELAAEFRYTFTPEEFDSLKSNIDSNRYTPLETSVYAFTLAKVLNKRGRYDEAFPYFRKANDLRRNILLEKNQAFDPRQHAAMVDRIIALYDKEYFERVRGWGLDTELPVFILGMPRSGSTLAEQILASHPQVYGAGELGEISRIVGRLASAAGADLYVKALPEDERTTRRIAADYIDRLSQLPGGPVLRITAKTLENFLHLGFIATLFPRARIIHTRRDPIDVCLSCYFQNFQDMPFSWRLEDIAAYYRAYEKLMAHWAKVLPVPVFDLRYEELVQNQEAVTRRLLSFCGLEWDPACLTFYDTERVVKTASTVQVRKPMSTKSVARWKLYRAHLEPLIKALGPSAKAELERHPNGASPGSFAGDIFNASQGK